MNRTNFFTKKVEFLTIAQVLEITGSTLYQVSEEKINSVEKIYDIATLEKANEKQISFLNSSQYFNKFLASNAGFCLVDEKTAAKNNHQQSAILIINKNPYFAYSQVAAAFYQEDAVEFANEKAVHPSAKIGEGARIAPLAYIGKNVSIGKNCFIGPNASVLDNCVIGDGTIINAGATVSYAVIGNNCIIYSGVRIGQDGFGFAHNAGVNHKIIQLGIVEIGNNVEIGANSCIDRGAIENTIIGDGTKIDNLVQIGHNVVIGKSTVIAGSTGVAGSAKIGNFVQIGGACNINGHITINDGAKIAGMSTIMRDVPAMAVMGGASPALPIREWHRLNAKLIAMSKWQKNKQN